ncbi:ornithine carbamoyltransferase [Acanthopleuribacter pedis]|uniref:Ornithine carbamoyltransferase n=1 Tax=Acanthopleuribacter pedis TaxID=442870 RepID=A0A8J7QD53_9BACT|nr:ornithine carbamoyltransferase [Acanthopleuribacter pedis]MBO1316883.1 ornithine carbamoyltransferase [Acanthopleuribacter pedis]
MAFNLKGRHLLTLADYTPREIEYLIDSAIDLKNLKRAGVFPKNLVNKNIALIFEKPSTRTRCAFVVACNDEGAFPEYLGKNDIQIGKKESIADTAAVLGRMFDGIQFRGFKHESVEGLAKHAGVPVWNGLTDKYHPTQILADFMTVKENFGRIKGIKFAYVGDGRNNMANSLLIGAAKMGMDFRIVAPADLFPEQAIQELAATFAAESGAVLTYTDQVGDGVAGCDVLYTDVWASMGEEDQIPDRIAKLKPFQVNQAMVDATQNEEVIFLHCLPAFHNDETELSRQFPDICEVTDEVFSGKRSRVFDQAENRMHTIKAVMVATLA